MVAMKMRIKFTNKKSAYEAGVVVAVPVAVSSGGGSSSHVVRDTDGAGDPPESTFHEAVSIAADVHA